MCRHYLLSAVTLPYNFFIKSDKRWLQLTGKLQTCSPAEDGSYSVERHTLVHSYILVAVQTAYNEVAPRQTPPAIQAQIYESPIQWPSAGAKTPSVPGKTRCPLLSPEPRWSDRRWGENTTHRSNSLEARIIRCTFVPVSKNFQARRLKWEQHELYGCNFFILFFSCTASTFQTKFQTKVFSRVFSIVIKSKLEMAVQK